MGPLYLPYLKRSMSNHYSRSKPFWSSNEGDDGRPILFEKHAELPGCYSVLGGKIDNIYDVFEKLDTEDVHNNKLKDSV